MDAQQQQQQQQQPKQPQLHHPLFGHVERYCFDGCAPCSASPTPWHPCVLILANSSLHIFDMGSPAVPAAAAKLGDYNGTSPSSSKTTGENSANAAAAATETMSATATATTDEAVEKAKDAKDAKEPKEGKDAKDTKPKDAKEPKEPKEPSGLSGGGLMDTLSLADPTANRLELVLSPSTSLIQHFVVRPLSSGPAAPSPSGSDAAAPAAAAKKDTETAALRKDPWMLRPISPPANRPESVKGAAWREVTDAAGWLEVLQPLTSGLRVRRSPLPGTDPSFAACIVPTTPAAPNTTAPKPAPAAAAAAAPPPPAAAITELDSQALPVTDGLKDNVRSQLLNSLRHGVMRRLSTTTHAILRNSAAAAAAAAATAAATAEAAVPVPGLAGSDVATDDGSDEGASDDGRCSVPARRGSSSSSTSSSSSSSVASLGDEDAAADRSRSRRGSGCERNSCEGDEDAGYRHLANDGDGDIGVEDDGDLLPAHCAHAATSDLLASIDLLTTLPFPPAARPRPVTPSRRHHHHHHHHHRHAAAAAALPMDHHNHQHTHQPQHHHNNHPLRRRSTTTVTIKAPLLVPQHHATAAAASNAYPSVHALSATAAPAVPPNYLNYPGYPMPPVHHQNPPLPQDAAFQYHHHNHVPHHPLLAQLPQPQLPPQHQQQRQRRRPASMHLSIDTATRGRSGGGAGWVPMSQQPWRGSVVF